MATVDPRTRLHQLANAYQISCAVHAAAAIDLGHHLAAGPLTAKALAQRADLNAECLQRLLCFLSTLGLVESVSAERFAANALTEYLHEIDNVAIGPEAVRAWATLPEVLRDGKSAFENANGASFYNYMSARPEKASRWALRNRLIAQEWAKPSIDAISQTLTLSGAEKVADLGAGGGDMLAALLEVYPQAKAVLCELPYALEAARADLVALAIENKVDAVACDLSSEPPPRADIYLLCRVLLNLANTEVSVLLAHCEQQMQDDSKLIIIEALMPEKGATQRPQHAGHNLHLLLMWGGRQRTKTEFAQLLKNANLKLDSCVDVKSNKGSQWHMLICSRI